MKPLAPGESINASQLEAVKKLTYALEKIQGPPGTGKSTTIFHIITSRVPRGARVLVTCSRYVNFCLCDVCVQGQCACDML